MIADQAARRGAEGDPGLAAAARAHVGQFGFAARHLLDHGARIFVVDVDHDGLVWLGLLAGFILAEQHARAADAELEAFAAHRLDQHAELEFAAAGDFVAVAVGRFGDLDRDIALAFAEQAVADHAAGDLGAFAPGHRRIVDREAHRQGRRIDRLGVERLGDRGVGDGVGDGRGGEAGDRDDVAGLGASSTGTRSSPRKAMIFDARPVSTILPSGLERVDRHVGLDRARGDQAGQDAAEEIVAIEQGDEEFERARRDRRRARAHGRRWFRTSGDRSPSRTSSVLPA